MSQDNYSTGQIAKLCGVSQKTVSRWIARGELDAITLPGTRGDKRVLREELIRFCQLHQFPHPGGDTPSKPRVLIVEDDKATSDVLALTLKKDNWAVDVAHNGFHAGIKLNEFQPHVLTLDLSMPGMGGLELLDFIKDSPSHTNVKVLVISALPPQVLEEAKRRGAHDAISKPFTVADVQMRVGRLLNQVGV